MIAYHVTHIANQVRRMRTMTASSSNSKSSPTTPSRAPAARWMRRSNHRRRARIGLRVHGRGGRVGRAPLRRALPMTGLRVMPPLRCENDAGGRFTTRPGPDSHGTHRVSADAAASYASAARPDVARRADEAEMGATPQAEGLVRAWGWVCFHTPVPALQGSLPVHQSLAGRPSACAASGVLRYR